MSNFTYVVAGVSKNNDPILATVWKSHEDNTDAIVNFLSSKTDYHEENESRQMDMIYRFVPSHSSEEYPKNKNTRLIKQIKEATGADVVIDCTWLEDIANLTTYAFSRLAHKIFLLRVNEKGLLEWREADLQLEWKAVDFFTTEDAVVRNDEPPF